MSELNMDWLRSKIENAAKFHSAARHMNPYDDVMIGRRLRLAREIIKPGGTLQDMADTFGVNDQAWNRWELGKTKLPVEMAFKIHERFAVERDWLLYGEERFLNELQRTAISTAAERVGSPSSPKVKTTARS